MLGKVCLITGATSGIGKAAAQDVGAAEFRRRYDRLHLLINCAGVIYGKRRVSRDGFEEGLAANHLAHFLLTNLLLDMLKASAPALSASS